VNPASVRGHLADKQKSRRLPGGFWDLPDAKK